MITDNHDNRSFIDSNINIENNNNSQGNSNNSNSNNKNRGYMVFYGFSNDKDINNIVNKCDVKINMITSLCLAVLIILIITKIMFLVITLIVTINSNDYNNSSGNNENYIKCISFSDIRFPIFFI